MNSVLDFVIKPLEGRYGNTKKIGDKELILNSEIYSHQFVSREAEVLAVPLVNETKIRVGMHIIVHHNIFRRYHDQYGVEKNSRSYYEEDKYFARADQIYMLKNVACSLCDWEAMDGFCFVKPIESNDIFSTETERPLMGIVKYISGSKTGFEVDDLVGFSPNSEYEFCINGERLYRMSIKSITLKYEYQGDEKEYNPSWTQSG